MLPKEPGEISIITPSEGSRWEAQMGTSAKFHAYSPEVLPPSSTESAGGGPGS